MSSNASVGVYLACSVDGYIAGPDHELGWLQRADPEAPPGDPEAIEFDAWMARTGAMLMGRGTYDVICGFDVPWPYGDTPVLVATRRPLDPVVETVRAVEGDIEALVAEAKAVAKDKQVYLDGGLLVRQALDAGLVDEMVLTMVPVLLAGGINLFEGLSQRRWLRFSAHHRMANGLLQVVTHPVNQG